MSQLWSAMWPQVSHPTSLHFIFSSFPSPVWIINFDVIPSERDYLWFLGTVAETADLSDIREWVVADTHRQCSAVTYGGWRSESCWPSLSHISPWLEESGYTVGSHGKPLRFASIDAPVFAFFHSLGLRLPSHRHSLVTTESFTSHLSLRKGKLVTIGLLGSSQPCQVYYVIVSSH